MAGYCVDRQSASTTSSSYPNISTDRRASNNAVKIIQMAKTKPMMLTSNEVSCLQRSIGNRAVGQLLSEFRDQSDSHQAPANDVHMQHDPARREQVGALPYAKTSSNMPIQRVILPVTGPSLNVLSNSNQAKLQSALQALINSGTNQVAACVDFRVVNTNALTPASTDVGNGLGIDIVVEIEKWYIETSSVGELIGLLSHELAVHNLADMAITAPDQLQDLNDASNPPAQITLAGQPHFNPTLPLVPPAQHDHVVMAHQNANHIQLDSHRSQFYRDVVFEAGNEIQNDPNIALAEKHRRQQDLVKTYLFDFAITVATNDSRGAYQTISEHSAIHDVMTRLLTYIRANAPLGHWILQPHIYVPSQFEIAVWMIGHMASYGINRLKRAIFG